MTTGVAPPELFLAVSPAKRSDRRLALAALIVSAVGFAVAAPLAKQPLGPLPAFIPSYQSALAINDLITAVLLFAQFAIMRRWGLLALACGYLFTSLIAVVHLLSFPGAFAPRGVIGGGAQTTAWLYMFWHGGFPLAVIYYAWTRNRAGDALAAGRSTSAALASAVALTMALAGAAALAATVGHDRLPPLMVGLHFTTAQVVAINATWMLSAVALAVLWLRPPHSILDLWLMVVACAWVFDVALSGVLNAARYDLGFYLGRIYGLLAATFVLVVLLSETSRLYARLALAFRREVDAAAAISRRIFETSVDLILVVGRKGDFIQVSPSAFAILGYRPEEMAGRNGTAFLYPADLENTRNEMRQGRLSGSPRSFQCRYVHKNGRVVPLAWTGIWSDPEQRHYFIGRDMTLRLAMEQELREAKDMFAAIIDASPFAIVCLDPDRRVMVWNRAAEAMFGYASGETVGQPYKLVPSGGEAEFERIFQSARNGQTLRDVEVMRQRKDGALRRIRFSGAPVSDGGGRFRCVIYVLQDITESHAMEQQLRQAQKLEAVGQLTGGIAHDFNNLLGVIIGNLDLMADPSDPKAQANPRAKSALDAAMRGAELVRRLMVFARRQPLSPTVFDVNTAIADFAPLLRRALGEAIELQLQLSPVAGRIAADKHQLENALMNLCVNARDATPGGGVIRVETAPVTVDAASAALYPDVAPGSYLTISVTDSGSGIAPEHLPRVFEPFFTTKAEGKGSGMGLSMVYGFMRESRGMAKIYSELGHGTTVRLYFPRTEAEIPPETAAGDEIAIPMGTETVLVVEDRADMRAVAVAVLERLGYRTLEAETGAAALAVLNSGARIDLVFSDIVMPGGMSGLDLAQEIRGQGLKTPILLTSGYASPQALRTRAQKLGLPLIGKPYRVADLATKVRAMLDGGNGNGRHGSGNDNAREGANGKG